MIKIERVLISELMKHYKPDEVIGYCENCKNYGQIWSCPPHDFVIEKYLTEFKYAYIISIKIDISKCETQDKSIKLFHAKRKRFNISLLELEKKITGTKVLYSGECHFCKSCSRKQNLPCIDKSKIRYSLESLGLKVSDICENILHEKLQWQKDKKIDHLFSIGAVLSKTEINISLTEQLFF